MKIVKLNEDSIKDILDNLLKRSPNNYKEQEQIVNDILANIRENGDSALFEYTKNFDKVEISAETVKVTQEEIDEEEARKMTDKIRELINQD